MSTAPQPQVTATSVITDVVVLPPGVAVTDVAKADLVAQVSWHELREGEHWYTARRGGRLLTRTGALEPDTRVSPRHLFTYPAALSAAERLVSVPVDA
jgi:hypothetical protein